jgi:hypothetical protein
MPSLELLVTVVSISIILLSLFILPVVPRFVWLTLLFAFMMTRNFDGVYVREPANREEACRRACERIFGNDNRFFLTRPDCIERCKTGRL